MDRLYTLGSPDLFSTYNDIQFSPLIALCLGSIVHSSLITWNISIIEIEHVISELYNIKGQFYKRNYRKMTILWSFPYNFVVKFHGKKLGATTC